MLPPGYFPSKAEFILTLDSTSPPKKFVLCWYCKQPIGTSGVRLSQTWSLVVKGPGLPGGLFFYRDSSSKLFPPLPPAYSGPLQLERMNRKSWPGQFRNRCSENIPQNPLSRLRFSLLTECLAYFLHALPPTKCLISSAPLQVVEAI